MKRIVTLILVVLLGYNSIGYYVIYHIQQLIAEREIKEYISSGVILEEQLNLFKVPVKEYYERGTKDFNRVAGDFEFNGKFYERVRETLVNDTMYIYCLNDEKQEMLFKQLSEHIEVHLLENKPNKDNKTQKLFKDLFKEYLPKPSNSFAFNIHIIILEEFSYSPELFADSVTLTIPSPPPWIS